ncbi:hypothetical protein AB0I45_13895 [Brevibacterium sp. NPDC049920]|uniref:hypothetical protein n=1 Tax=Brevibacterium TaxID=1696 RepID=UPI0031E6810D
MATPMHWTLEEMILAADVANDLKWTGVRANTPGIPELSELLRSADYFPPGACDASFRSPNSVAMKINNLRSSHPSKSGIGLRASRAELPVVQSFVDDPFTMENVAARIRDCILQSRPSKGLAMELMAFATNTTWNEAMKRFPSNGISSIRSCSN